MMEIATLVSRHKIPEVSFLLFDIVKTAIPMWGWNLKSGEVPAISFADTIFEDDVLA